ncbi:MAG: Uma2 family endonuclease [Chloroflexi bacterium]|nr:Uma2 family endonuclease [Chloroflexota bacterium]
MVTAPTKRKLSVDDYHRMWESGVFGHEERVELIDGELYAMGAIGPGHGSGTMSLNYLLNRRVGERAYVHVQNPIVLSDYSEPEPDITLLRPRSDFYWGQTPSAEDVLLLIEIADSSLSHDRNVKLPRYASAGVPEVWIVNLVDRCVEVYRGPTGDRYLETLTYVADDVLHPSAFPDVAIAVTEIIR